MIGEFIAARHTEHGPVLIADFVPGGAVCILINGDLRELPLETISADWHYDEGKGEWKSDFSTED